MEIVPVTAAGGVLFDKKDDGPRILLIFRRGVWDLPKGKVEGEESIRECAQREVSEEVGCPPPEIRHKLGTTYHEYDEDNEHIGKTTHWYAMQVDAGMNEDFTPEEEEDITEVAWFHIEEAKEKVGFENLRTVLANLQEWLH